MKTILIKMLINNTVIFHHIQRRCITEKMSIVRYIEKLFLCFYVFKYLFSIYGHMASICLKDPCGQTEKSGFTGSVCSDQTKYRATFNLCINMIYCHQIIKFLCQVHCLDHLPYLLPFLLTSLSYPGSLHQCAIPLL